MKSRIKNLKNRISRLFSGKRGKKLLAVTSALVLFVTAMPLAEVSPVVSSAVSALTGLIATVSADDSYTYITVSNKSYTINSQSDLTNLFNADPYVYQNITITFATTSDEALTTPSGKSLGSEAYPFKGTVAIASGSAIKLELTDSAMFAYLDDSATLCEMTISNASAGTAALLAENVTHSDTTTEAKSWNIIKGTTTDSGNNAVSNQSSGMIGKMAEDAIVNLTVTLTATTAIAGTSTNVGLFCNDMGERSSLTATLADGSGSYTVTSSSGAAGGLVGYMGDDATLTVGNFTFTSTITGANAGGLVGKAENISSVTKSDGATVSVTGTITSNTASGGAGGLIGSLELDKECTFTASDWTNVAPTVQASASSLVGGYFGVLTNSSKSAAITIQGDTSSPITSTLTQSSTINGMGGVIGRYEANNLAASLVLDAVTTSTTKNKSPNYFGGLIGIIKSGYVKISNATVSVTGSEKGASTSAGGLVGCVTAGAIDVNGATITYEGYYGSKNSGGFVGSFEGNGVLRLSGGTDLSNAYVNSEKVSATNCQLVGNRNNALIYAESGWTLTRHEGTVADDVGKWGEVIRFSDTFESVDVLTFDESTHVVTVTGFESNTITIASLADFAKAHIIGTVDATNNDYVKLSQSGATYSNIASANITLSADVDLKGTGITGLFRDVFESGNSTATKVYEGTFDGGNYTITLAAGEEYSASGSGSNGKLVYHNCCGLIGNAKNATIKNLEIAGVINDYNKGSGAFYIGSAVALAYGDTITMTDVKSSAIITIGSGESLSYTFVGGLLGRNGRTDDTAVSRSVAVTTMTDCTFSGNLTYNIKTAKEDRGYGGGIIGFIDYCKSTARLHTLKNVTVSGTIFCKQAQNDVRFGGLIGLIKGNASSSSAGTVENLNLENIEISELTMTTTVKSGGCSGGLLGHGWYDTNVTFDGVKVNNSTLTVNGTSAAFGGLVYAATGYWNVKDIDITGSTFTATDGDETKCGLLVNVATTFEENYLTTSNTHYDETKNKTYDKSLYLEITATDGYKIDSTVKIDLGSSYSVFDEIAAFSTTDNGEGANGQGVISIPAVSSDGTTTVIMDGASCNTYQNQTKDSSDNDWENNPNTRYYYNLDTIRTSKSTAEEKMMLASLALYANTNIKSYFSGGSWPTTSGETDLNGYSYYPVTVDSDVTIGGTVIFYNDKIEAAEALTGGAYDAVDRDTDGSADEHTQHYMMHHALFYNVTDDLTVNDLTLSGNVGKTDQGSGALVCGTITGSSTTSLATATIKGVTLRDLYVNGDTSTSGYAPLLINTITQYATVSVSNVKTAKADSTYYMGSQSYAGTSLMGNVGSKTAEGIILTFSGIKLDARSNDTKFYDLDSVYGTTKSIFSHATLLESFAYSGSSSGVYNYTEDEDWGDSTPRNVTYGKEVSGSVEYAGKENKYYNSYVYTNPEEKGAENEYDFSTGWLPYVCTAYSATDNTHELSVNITVLSLYEGCGSYSDPYIINSETGGELLAVVASLISTGSAAISDDWTVNYLWNDENNYASCDGESKNSSYHKTYKYNAKSNVFVNENDSTDTLTVDEVREYLCKAYYKVTGDIELSSSYEGLGGTTEVYGFRGVIVGSEEKTDDTGGTVTITNNSSNPLIKNSNGSVVKDVTIKQSSVTVTADNSTTAAADYDFAYSSGCSAYGAVMGKVFGGDNIIDNVSVEVGTITVSKENTATSDPVDKSYLVPIGGYVGVIVYGGVYFRNMSGTSGALTSTKIDGVDENSTTYLYRNPYIGRVLNGFAVEEGDSFGSSTLNNTSKNYVITKLNTSEAGKLSYSGTTITVPNAQALFVLGAISQSGALDSSGYNDKSVYGTYFATRRADYTNVGTTGTTDRNASQKDYANGSASASVDISTYTGKLPRMVANYSEGDAGIVLNSAAEVILSGGCDVSNTGFRGINCVFDVSVTNFDAPAELAVTTLTGGDKTVTMGYTLQAYNGAYYTGSNSQINSSITATDNYELKGGVGLVNYSSKLTAASNLSLAGSVKLTEYSKTTTDLREDNPTGGLIGYSQVGMTITSVKLDDSFTVTGCGIAGGIIGKGDKTGAKWTLNNCTSGGVTVSAWGQAGGMIGLIPGYHQGDEYSENNTNRNHTIVIKGSDNGSDFKISSVTISRDTNADDSGAGGLIGTADCNIEISAMNVKAKSASDSCYVGYSGKKAEKTGHSGGVIGVINTTETITVKIENVNTAIDVYGNNAGGFLGRVRSKNITNFTLDGCTYGDSDSNYKYTVQGRSDIGGMVAYTLSSITVNKCTVINAKLQNNASETYTAPLRVGGIVGHLYNPSGGSNFVPKITSSNFTNITVQGCELAYVNSSQSQTKTLYIGGVIAQIDALTTAVSINGYNILLNNLTMPTTNDGKFSTTPCRKNIIADDDGRSTTTIKLVGVSKQGDIPCATDYPTTNSSSYVIMADYNGACLEDDANESFDAEIAEDENNVEAASPWVTTNPLTTVISSFNLISDGAKTGVPSTIISDAATGQTVTSAPYSKAYNNTNIQTYAADFQEKYEGNLSTFKAECTAASDEVKEKITDFPVLVISDSSNQSLTDMLTDYISVLADKDFEWTEDTNSTYKDFSLNGIGDITIKTYEYDETENTFVAADNASLSFSTASSYSLFMTSKGHYDNTGVKFTLIDVAFDDPTGTSTYAYHLQIPVFVKKVLEYDFNSRVLTGTDYLATDYTDDKTVVIESFGENITTYFTYTYYRTAEEWQAALNAGDPLLWNFDKKLNLWGDNAASGILPTGTELTLVDRNNNDKAYYLTTKSETISSTDGLFELNSFDGFKDNIISLNALLMKYADVTAAKSDTGTLVTCEKTEATCQAYLYGTLTYFRTAGDEDNEELKYTITVAAKDGTTNADGNILMKENYYLTIKTPSTTAAEVIKNYVKSSTLSSDDLPTSDVSTTSNAANATYVLGNFISQTITVEDETNSTKIELSGNNTVSATFTATVTVPNEMKDTFSAYANSMEVYQGFKLSLKDYDSSTNSSAASIASGTTINVTYTLDDGAAKKFLYSVNKPADYYFIQYPDSIKSSLNDADGKATLKAEISLTYSTSQGIIDQFPEKDTSNTESNIGIAVAGASNISYDKETLETSTITVSAEGKNHYYREKITSATLQYNVPDKSYFVNTYESPNDQLGVNPKDENVAETDYDITAWGLYDVSDLSGTESAVKVKYVLSLQQKQKDGTYTDVTITDYLKDITLTDKNGLTVTKGDNDYTFTTPFDQGTKTYNVATTYNVLTGTKFESNSYIYANYRVVLTACLLDENGNEIANSSANDYIVYTNAKICTNFVTGESESGS